MNDEQLADVDPTDGAVLEDPIEAATVAAYRNAGLIPGGLGPVAPLRRLVAAYGLVVEEISKLSRASADHYFRKHGGPSIERGEQEDERLSGFMYANAGGGWILTELDHPLTRRRFTIAHEIGHYHLHFLPALEAAPNRTGLTLQEELASGPEVGPEPARSEGNLTLDSIPAPRAANSITPAQMEEDADRFAAALLLPPSVVRDLTAKHAPRCGGRRAILTRLLAGECLVSTAAVGRRLGDLGLGRTEPAAGAAQ